MSSPSTPIIPDNLFLQELRVLSDVSAERVTLAILMLQPMLIVEAQRTLAPDAFFIDLNNYIYRIMLWMAEQATQHNWVLAFDKISMLSAARFLGKHFEDQFLVKTEGMEQVRGIEDLMPMVSADQFPQYHAKLIDLQKRRAMHKTSRALQKAVMDFTTYPEAGTLGIKAEQAFSKIVFDTTRKEGTIRRISDYQEQSMQRVRLQRKYPMHQLFNVRCPKFTFWMGLMNGGFMRKGLTMICARPKVGKSTMLLNLATEMSIGSEVRDVNGELVDTYAPVPCLYLDTEMSAEEMFFRQLSSASSVLESNILAGKYFDENGRNNSAEIIAGLERLHNSQFYYCNIAGADIDHIKSVMRQFRNQHVGTHQVQDPLTGEVLTFSRPGMIFYDWLKLSDGGDLRNAREDQLLGFQTSAIKQSAYELDLPVLAAAQLNREAVGATSDDWEWNAESFIGASDRLSQFCSMMCVLRNLTPDEIDSMPKEWAEFRTDKVGEKRYRYNQKLHVILGRSCGIYRPGIPMYIDRGFARYQEVAENDVIEYFEKRSSRKPPVNKAGPKAKNIQSSEGAEQSSQQKSAT